MEGLEISEISFLKLDITKTRLDAEFYQKFYLDIDVKIKQIGKTSLPDINAKLDCSAFYPSITDHYNFEFNGIPFLRVNEISGGLVKITENTAFLPQSVLDKNTSTIAIGYPGDLIIAKGGNTLAKVGLITSQFPKYALSRDIILVRTNKINNYNKYFLWLFMHSGIGQALLWRTASQTGQPHLTLPSIEEIGLPKYSSVFENTSKDLYKKSVALNTESKICYKKAKILLLEALELSNFKPTEKAVNVKSFSESLGTSGRFDAEYYQLKYEEVISEIQKHEYYSLSQLVDISKSIEPGSSAYSESGLPFLRVADYSKQGITEPQKYLNEFYVNENWKKLDELKPKKGTILFSKDGSVGTAYQLTEDFNGITSSAILHLKVKENKTDKILPEYLTLALNSMLVKMQAERDAGGSIILHWRVSEIKDVIVPIIDFDVQQQIADLINQSFKLKKQSEGLLEVAKCAVEIAIEESEEVAMNYINEQM